MSCPNAPGDSIIWVLSVLGLVAGDSVARALSLIAYPNPKSWVLCLVTGLPPLLLWARQQGNLGHLGTAARILGLSIMKDHVSEEAPKRTRVRGDYTTGT